MVRLRSGLALGLLLISPVVAYASDVQEGEATLTLDAQGDPGGEVAGVQADEGGVSVSGGVEITFDNGSTKMIAGDVGSVQWRTEGTSVIGVMKTDAGTVYAEIEGSIVDGVLSGSFVDAGGQTGVWRWTGPLPGQLQ